VKFVFSDPSKLNINFSKSKVEIAEFEITLIRREIFGNNKAPNNTTNEIITVIKTYSGFLKTLIKVSNILFYFS